MMHRLNLDFAARARRAPWAGAMLFAVAFAVAGDAAWSYVHARRTFVQAETLLARAHPRQASRAVPAEEVAAARDTVQRLTLPWPGLFGALETAASDDVALLAIEPDPRAGKVTIRGDSKDYLAALAYVLNLSRSPALSGVELVRHEVKQNDPRHAVAFSVSAAWKEVKR
jgi:type IV pilus assembly PilN-like protein